MLKVGMFIQSRYEIVGKIGAGGTADVYKARDHKLNRFVAVKVLKPELRNDKTFLSKFRAEAQAAAGLAHPNIVNIYDVGEEKELNFIVMELVEGITLKDYIMKKGRLAVREATSIAIQAAQGLEAAHNSGIIHRDVKPQNIIISTDGKVKVTDFGIAKAMSSNTISTNVMGSVHYTSPEQARGGYSDAKSDIYSLGITFYEMITGRVPFDGDTTVAIAIKHLQEEMVSPKEYVSNLPKSTEQIILKATQKSPDRRYPDMMALIRDLKESLVNPGGSFVTIPSVVSDGKTIVISQEELSRIKEGAIQRQPENTAETVPGYNQNVYTHTTYKEGSSYGRTENGQPYDPYAYGIDATSAYGKRGYDFEGPGSSGFAEDEDDKGILSPRLEKLMLIGSIIIAVLIVAIFAGLIANALGVIRFSVADLFKSKGPKSAVEKTVVQETEQKQEEAVLAQTDAFEDWETEVLHVPAQTEMAESLTESGTDGQEDIVEPGNVPVPNVIGKDFQTAMNEMMTAGFYVEENEQSDENWPKGIVMQQSLAGEAKPGSTAVLTVSKGPANPRWYCNAQLDLYASGYAGQKAKLELHQGDNVMVISEGKELESPYDVSMVEGMRGETSGEFVLYVWDELLEEYSLYAYYDAQFEEE